MGSSLAQPFRRKLNVIGNRSKNRRRKNIVNFKKKYMNNSTKAMLSHLLTGKPINIKTSYIQFGFSNPAREVARKIEKPFDLELIRTLRKFKSKYGIIGYYFDYNLAKSDFTKVKKIIDAK